MGATPEQLLKVEGNLFKTMALAGTQKNTGYEIVEWNDKEKQEQQFEFEQHDQHGYEL